MSFYAYNPLAGGLLTGKHAATADDAPGPGRFAENEWYLDRYWKRAQFRAVDAARAACEHAGLAGPLPAGVVGAWERAWAAAAPACPPYAGYAPSARPPNAGGALLGADASGKTVAVAFEDGAKATFRAACCVEIHHWFGASP